MSKFNVRDRRRKGWYSVDNQFLRGGWGKLVGPYGIAVYDAIALHADADTQSAYPSHELIADLTGMSRPTVIKAIEKLEEFKIIGIERRRNKPHLYYLLDKSEWAGVNVVDTELGVNEVDSRCKRGLHPGVNEVYTNNTQLTKPKNNTHNNNVATATPSRFTSGQSQFLECFGAKTFKTKIQAQTILELEQEFGTTRVIELAQWAAKVGMNVGRAVVAVESRLKKEQRAEQRAVAAAQQQADARQQRQTAPRDPLMETFTQTLKGMSTRDEYAAWFAQLILEHDNGKVRVIAPDARVLDWISHRSVRKIKLALSGALDGEFDVEYALRELPDE